jgi:hypothetical protein
MVSTLEAYEVMKTWFQAFAFSNGSTCTAYATYSFGTSVRGALTNNTNPGPGAYD